MRALTRVRLLRFRVHSGFRGAPCAGPEVRSILKANLISWSLPRRQEVRQHLPRGVDDDAGLGRVDLQQSRSKVLGLFECDVGWQRRDLGVGLELDQDRAVGTQRLAPTR